MPSILRKERFNFNAIFIKYIQDKLRLIPSFANIELWRHTLRRKQIRNKAWIHCYPFIVYLRLKILIKLIIVIFITTINIGTNIYGYLFIDTQKIFQIIHDFAIGRLSAQQESTLIMYFLRTIKCYLNISYR